MAFQGDGITDQEMFDNFTNINQADTQVLEAGSQFSSASIPPDHELEEDALGGVYDTFYNTLELSDSLDDAAILLAQQQPQERGHYIGLENTTFAPAISVHDAADVRINHDTLRQYDGGNQEQALQKGPCGYQNTNLITRSHGPRSQCTASTPATEDSSLLHDDLTAPLTAYTSYSSSHLSTSQHTPAGFKCEHPKCAHSLTRYETLSSLKKHARNHIPYEQRPHVCRTCGSRWLFRKDLKRHIEIHSETKDRHWPCPDCGEKFQRADHLKRHQETACRNLSRRASSATSSQPLGNIAGSLAMAVGSLPAESELHAAQSGTSHQALTGDNLVTPPRSIRRLRRASEGGRGVNEHAYDPPSSYEHQSASFAFGSSTHASNATENRVRHNLPMPPFTPPPSANRTRAILPHPPGPQHQDMNNDSYPSPAYSPDFMTKTFMRGRGGYMNQQN